MDQNPGYTSFLILKTGILKKTLFHLFPTPGYKKEDLLPK